MDINQKIDEKKKVALISIFGAILITCLKLLVGLETNSLGILSEAAHSGLDLLAAIMTYVAVSIADKPPDEQHHYGHGKIENVSAFLETLLLLITCAWIIWEAINRLITKTSHVEVNVWGFLVIALSILIDTSRSKALKKIAKKYNSQALEADALHFASDIWTSLVVIIGLVFVSFGYIWLDATAAIAVALLVLFVSYRLGRRTIDALMDRVPRGIQQEIQNIIKNIDGVEKIGNIRVRTSGGKLFIDTTVSIQRTTPFQQAHNIMDRIEKAIHNVYHDADVLVHAEPIESKNETMADKIGMIVMEKGLRAPHNLEIHHKNGKYQIDFDIEHRQGNTFVQAHEITTQIEDEIRRKIDSVERVTIHMEESDANNNEISDESTTHIEEEIRQFVIMDKRVLNCPEVGVIKIGNKYNLSLTCQFDKVKTLDEVHNIICELETNLYRKYKDFRRITVHAEPI